MIKNSAARHAVWSLTGPGWYAGSSYRSIGFCTGHTLVCYKNYLSGDKNKTAKHAVPILSGQALQSCFKRGAWAKKPAWCNVL